MSGHVVQVLKRVFLVRAIEAGNYPIEAMRISV